MSSNQETNTRTNIAPSSNTSSISASYYLLYNTLPSPPLHSPQSSEEERKKESSTDKERHPSYSSGTTFWEEDKWSEEFELKAKKTLERNKQKCQLVSTIPSCSKPSASSIRYHNGTFWVHKYEKEAHLHWDGFYERNQTNFFKDRHYLHKTFPNEARYFMGEYFDADAESEFEGEEGETVVVEEDSKVYAHNARVQANSSNLEKHCQEDSNKIYTLFEIGCGVGNNILPLLSKNPHLDVRCFDFSSIAIDLLNQNMQFMKAVEERRASAHVWDITKTLDSVIPAAPLEQPSFYNKADFSMLLFCLSAINPEKMQTAVHNVAATIKPGGVILFRDYGRYDEAQMKLGTQRGKGLGENFYVKHDGTRCYYFDLDDLKKLFGEDGFGKNDKGACLEILELDYIRRSYMNRSTKTVRRRVWVQGRFRKPFC